MIQDEPLGRFRCTVWRVDVRGGATPAVARVEASAEGCRVIPETQTLISWPLILIVVLAALVLADVLLHILGRRP